MSEKCKLTVGEPDNGLRLDKFLALNLQDISRVQCQKLLKDGKVSVNGKTCTLIREILKSGDLIEFELPEVSPDSEILIGEKIPLHVLFEDKDMLVINKPFKMPVHPGAGNHSGTVVNALIGRDPDFINALSGGASAPVGDDEESSDEEKHEAPEESLRPGIVHRLDKDTSGCLVIAKNASSLYKLSKAFADRQVSKIYLAVLAGWPINNSGELKTQLGRHPVSRQKMSVLQKGGREAHTAFKILKKGWLDGLKVCVVELNIYTGRTHQIRVHMAHIKCPVLGDAVYGGRQQFETAIPRQMLHAWKLTVPHPTKGEKVSFEAPIPKDMKKIINKIEVPE